MSIITWRNSAVALVLILYFLVQCQGLNAPFLHGDDQHEIAFANSMDAWWRCFGADCFGLFRPIKNFLFLGFSRLSVFGMAWCRLIAIAIGVFSFFSVKAFFRRVLAGEKLPLLAAAVWILSPTLVSSVAWLSCVNIQLMCAFAALAFSAHIDGRQVRAAAFLLLACLSYELAVVLGPALVAYDFFLREERFKSRAGWRNYAGYALVTLGYLIVRAAVGCAGEVNGSFVGCERADLMLASAYFTLQHFRSWLVPFGRMAIFGSYTNGTVAMAELVTCWAALVALAASVFVFRRRAPVYSFGIALAGIAFLPVGNFLGLANGPYGDYYLGISSMGFALAAVSVFGGVLESDGGKRLLLLALGAVFLGSRALGVVESALWVRCWCDTERAARANIRTFPKAYYPHVVLARMHCNRGCYDEALSECDEADRLTGTDTDKLSSSLIVRALCAMYRDRDAESALKLLAHAQEIDGHSKNQQLCHFYRGYALEELLKDDQRARQEYSRSVETALDADNVEAANRLACLLAADGNLREAVELWERAYRISSDETIAANLKIARERVSQVNE